MNVAPNPVQDVQPFSLDERVEIILSTGLGSNKLLIVTVTEAFHHPTLSDGDTVLVELCDSCDGYPPNSLILYKSPNGYVVSRKRDILTALRRSNLHLVGTQKDSVALGRVIGWLVC